jgi:hypothetical protein
MNFVNLVIHLMAFTRWKKAVLSTAWQLSGKVLMPDEDDYNRGCNDDGDNEEVDMDLVAGVAWRRSVVVMIVVATTMVKAMMGCLQNGPGQNNRHEPDRRHYRWFDVIETRRLHQQPRAT